MSQLRQANNSRIPLVTLTFAALMVAVTNVWFIAGLCGPSSCHVDWRTLSGFASLVVWSFVSPFIHLNFPHLAADVTAFVFLGSLVEVWATRILVKVRYQILMVGYGGSVFVSLLDVFRGGGPAGASLWDYALLAVPLYYWFKFHKETRWFLSYPILGGLLVLFIPLGQMVYFGLLPSIYTHLAGVVWGALIPLLILDKSGFRRET